MPLGRGKAKNSLPEPPGWRRTGAGGALLEYAIPVEGESAYYRVDEAAAILQLTPERVREMLVTGELEGIPPGATAQGDWEVLLQGAANLGQSAPVDEPRESPPEEQEESRAADEGAESLVEPPSERADAGDESSENYSRRELLATERAVAETRQTSAEPVSESGWVTTEVAGEALSVSPPTIRDYIASGKLEAKSEGEGVERRWLVSIDSVQVMLQARQASERSPRVRRAEARGGEVAADIARDLLLRVQELQYKLGRTEARAELTERAESTLREDLERERVERLEAQRRVEQARSTLEEERRRREAAERERDELRCRLADVEEPGTQEPSSGVGPQAAALEGAQDPSEVAQTRAAALEEEANPRSSTWSTQAGAQRPWWRRWFGS
jgi:hypothetical protein